MYQATSPVAPPNSGKSQTKSEKRSGNTLYQELSFHDIDASMVEGDESADITGKYTLVYNLRELERTNLALKFLLSRLLSHT